MSMLTTEQLPTSGSASVAGHDVVRDTARLREDSSMGYCPQFDALYEMLTVEEHLGMFCVLQGIRGAAAVAAAVDEAVRALDLGPHRGKRAWTLSGGNKRKPVGKHFLLIHTALDSHIFYTPF